MKTYKKLLVGAASLLVMGLLFVAVPKHAAADGTATLSDLTNCNKTFQWVDYAHISCQLSGNQKAIFTDSNPDARDTTNHYVFVPPSGLFCGADPHYQYAVAQEGLVVQPNNNFQVLYFNEGYLKHGQSGCFSFSDATGKDPTVATIKASAHTMPRSPNRSAIVLAGTDTGAQSLADVTDGKFAGYNFVRWKSDYDPANNTYLFAQNISLNTIGGDCTGDILAVTTDKNGDSVRAREYTLGISGDPLSKYSSDLKHLPKAPTCRVADYNFGSGDINQYPADQIFISPAIKNVSKIGAGDVTQGSSTANNNSSGSSPGTCESSSGLLNWLTCPLLNTAQDAANFLYKEFESLLSFNVSKDLGDTSSQASVKKTWSLVRNLATAFLLILMLIMVFSQAISAGPFDAYTVRKMLPRLIAAAIAIQLSWAIVAWVIGIFDDLGKGIADIMYWPFGGLDALSLQKLLHHAGIGDGKAAIIDYTSIGAGLVLGAAAFPAVLLMVLGAVAAIFTGYFTLIMRKIIIIVLLIFAPIAMLAYVLPNTQKYWKMWYDNLIKILFMFPLIVILISSGRIFAYIAGGQDTNIGTVLNFILVMVAFFGPLFLLPKTYKWGGQAMSMASGAVGGISNRYLGRESALGKGVQGFGERTQGQIAKGYDPNASRTSRIMRRVGSGHILPTPRSRRLAIAAGDKWASERNDEADALAARTQEKAMNGYDYWERNANGDYIKFNRAKNASGQWIDKNGKVVATEQEAAYADKAGKAVADKRMAYSEVTTNKDEAYQRLTGVEAGKQALVDLTGQSGSVAKDRLAQAAQKKLLDTSSEIELQNSVIQSGDNVGKRVSETASWKKNVASSPQHYSTINKGRFDMAPDLIESAEDAAVKKRGLKEGTTIESADEAEKLIIDQERLRIAIQRMTPENMQSTHYGFYQDVARVAQATGDDSIARALAEKIQDFNYNGGTIGSSAAGSLRGGRAEHVDKALAALGTNPATRESYTLADITAHVPPGAPPPPLPPP